MALKLLEVQFGGSAATKAMIADRMRDGRLKCRAKETWISEAVNTSSAWRAGHIGDVTREAEIKSSVWKASKRWIADQSRWKWASGRFSITRRIKPGKRQMLVGVQFLQGEIDALMNGPVPPSSRKGVGGRPPKIEKRNDVWMAAMRMMRNDEMTGFTSQQALIDALLEKVDESLSEKVVREIAKPISEEFCPNIK